MKGVAVDRQGHCWKVYTKRRVSIGVESSRIAIAGHVSKLVA